MCFHHWFLGEVLNHQLVVLYLAVLLITWMIRGQIIPHISVLVFTSVKWSPEKLLLLEEWRRFFRFGLQPVGSISWTSQVKENTRWKRTPFPGEREQPLTWTSSAVYLISLGASLTFRFAFFCFCFCFCWLSVCYALYFRDLGVCAQAYLPVSTFQPNTLSDHPQHSAHSRHFIDVCQINKIVEKN